MRKLQPAPEAVRVVQQKGGNHNFIMRQAAYEFTCHDPADLTDAQLIGEILAIKTGRKRGICRNGKVRDAREYLGQLEAAANFRSLAYPTGIASTAADRRNLLDYGARFTHQLQISGVGGPGNIRGTFVKEDIKVDYDDFGLTTGPMATWTLGTTAGSRRPGEFTDHVETPWRLIQDKIMAGRVKYLPSGRGETQHLYWRRLSTDTWQKFATIKVYFRVDWCRNKPAKICAITRDNAQYVEQELKGILPRAAIRAERRRRRR